MWQTLQRLQLALRLHLAARRHLALHIDLALLLSHPRYAHDMLALCHDSGHGDLARLARHYALRNGRASARACLALATCQARADLAHLPASATRRPSVAAQKLPTRLGCDLPTRVPTCVPTRLTSKPPVVASLSAPLSAPLNTSARVHAPQPLWAHSAHGA